MVQNESSRIPRSCRVFRGGFAWHSSTLRLLLPLAGSNLKSEILRFFLKYALRLPREEARRFARFKPGNRQASSSSLPFYPHATRTLNAQPRALCVRYLCVMRALWSKDRGGMRIEQTVAPSRTKRCLGAAPSRPKIFPIGAGGKARSAAPGKGVLVSQV
jgi:hypothetical protein